MNFRLTHTRPASRYDTKVSSAQTIDAFKLAASEAAAAHLESGMIVGLGSGSTAELAVAAIGRRVTQGLKIIGIPTSEKTAALATQWNIPLSTLEDHPRIDLAIDGADEIDTTSLNLIKGGGGNLMREKLVVLASARFLVVADERKLVPYLGHHFPLPIDIMPFGWKSTAARISALGLQPKLRLTPQGEPFLTDGGQYILDCTTGPIHDPRALEQSLNNVVGLVEHGLFLGLASQAFIAGPDGIRTFSSTNTLG